MWYVIQTVTGKEEELMLLIRFLLSQEDFKNCFAIHAEWMKRLGGEWLVQTKSLFPGYVFMETEKPDRIFMELKSVPRFSRLLGNGKNEFVPVKKEEERFLRKLTNTEVNTKIPVHPVIKLTTVETKKDGGIILKEGALSLFQKEIVKINLHKRYAVVKTGLLGEERSLVFGIRLKGGNQRQHVQ